MEKFIITKNRFTNIKRFNLRGQQVEFKIKPVPLDSDPVLWVKGAVEDIVRHVTKDLQPTDQVGFTFCGRAFERGQGWMRFKEASTVTFDDIWNLISKIFQSNSLGLSTDLFCLGVTSVRLPRGQGRGTKYNNFEEECCKRKGIIVIKNKDNLCLPRALVTAIANKVKDSEYKKVRCDIGKEQLLRAVDLTKEACVVIPPDGASIHELDQFQQHLKTYKIVVYQYGSKGRDVIFEGSVEGPRLNLLYHKGHYNVITSLTSAFCCDYYCETCHVPYNTKNAHRCVLTCPCCQEAPVCAPTNNIECTDCNRKFRGPQCFNNHKKSVCGNVKRCKACLKTYKSDRAHVCNEIFCKTCAKHVPSGHLCYIRTDTRKPILKDTLYVFYDLETRQEKDIGNGALLHEPNLCVIQQRCDMCIDENIVCCQKCGLRHKIFDKEETIRGFISYILTVRKKFKKVVVIAHNGQAFDHQFMLNYIINKSAIKPDLIMRGTKIILMQIDNVRFIDSLNYFPMSLSKLPKAFDLDPEIKKGYFPYLFNTEANQNYVGPLPPVEYYSPDSMKSEDRTTFLKWYTEHKYDEFDMQRDLMEYCISDVQILAGACLKFRKLMLEQCNVEPFIEATTIASVCNLVYRRNFLKPHTIGIIPKNGYRLYDNQSAIALQWLIHEEQQRCINIHHSAKGSEVLVNGVKVDGYCAETNQVFEFQGCYWHGHPECLKFRRDEALCEDPADTLNRRYETTQAKIDRLKMLGYDVIEMWECDFRRQTNKKLNYLKNHPILIHEPLNPRDAFYGGRTGNTKTYYKCKEAEKIKYIDVCSLYPYVCKYGKFPVGHPKVIVGHEDCSKLDLSVTEGLVKCTILPPQNLYHPVLPLKMNGKLMFVLCKQCGNDMNKSTCGHSESERALTGVWVIDEVRKAIEMGYRMMTVHEVWAYQIEQYDKTQKMGGLFTGMMNKFLKIKQQASGWPNNCVAQEDKKRYIDDFLTNEGIKLEFTDITNNSGLRSLAKLILNSFWGKFGQRENQPKTTIVDQPSELYDLCTNPSICVNHIAPVNDNTIIVNWEYKEEAADSLSTVNVCIAAFVTAQARLKLYSYMEFLGSRVLYYDTDSLIYISKDAEWEPPTGEFVGDMTDELASKFSAGTYITEFVSGGPKNYAYKVFPPPLPPKSDTVCTVKGICLNYEASRLVNFEKMKEMVLREQEKETEPVYVMASNFRRTTDHNIITKTGMKIYRTRAEKRKFTGVDSVPFGYKHKQM